MNRKLFQEYFCLEAMLNFLTVTSGFHPRVQRTMGTEASLKADSSYNDKDISSSGTSWTEKNVIIWNEKRVKSWMILLVIIVKCSEQMFGILTIST